MYSSISVHEYRWRENVRIFRYKILHNTHTHAHQVQMMNQIFVLKNSKSRRVTTSTVLWIYNVGYNYLVMYECVFWIERGACLCYELQKISIELVLDNRLFYFCRLIHNFNDLFELCQLNLLKLY